MKFLLPLILMLVGTGGGVGAAMFLAPAPVTGDTAASGDCLPLENVAEHAADAHGEEHGDDHGDEVMLDDHGEPISGTEYARLNNQFVVPVVSGERVAALVILSITVEVRAGAREDVLLHEPKLRDAFLEILFDHATIGGFDGSFTSTRNMAPLRTALLNAARETVGNEARDILILDLVRQDMPG